MARGRAGKAERPALAPPPCHLAKAAEDRTTMWVLDVNTPWGRRVYFGTLDHVEANLPESYVDENGVAEMAPDYTVWMFPAESAFARHKYKKMAARGWMRSTRWQAP